MATPAADPKIGPRAKIERAKEHLAEFQQGVLDFISREPYVGRFEIKPDRSIDFPMQVREYPPARLSAVAGDVIQNARSALDLLACHLVGKENAPINGVQFPIAPNRATFEKNLLDYMGKANAKSRRFIERLKPYSGGNETLSLLRRINNRDKHRMLVVIGAAAAWIRIVPAVFDPSVMQPAALIKSAPILEDGDIALTLTGADAANFYDAEYKQMRFEIRLSGVEGLPDTSARQILSDIVTMVDRIVGIAERKLF